MLSERRRLKEEEAKPDTVLNYERFILTYSLQIVRISRQIRKKKEKDYKDFMAKMVGLIEEARQQRRLQLAWRYGRQLAGTGAAGKKEITEQLPAQSQTR